MGLNYFVQYYGHVMGVKMQAQMRSDMFRRLEEVPYSFYDSHETGKIMSRMTNDLMDISELAHHGPENLLISGITIITSFCYLISINVPLTLIVFACVPLLVIISLSLRVKMRDAFKKSRESVAEINAALESSISGIRVTKAFTNSEKETEKFEVGNGKFVSSRSAAYKAMGQFHSGTSFVTDIFNVVVLIAGGLFLYNNKISFGDYSTFIVSIGIFVTPVMTLINFMEQYQNGVTGFERFVEMMDDEARKGHGTAREDRRESSPGTSPSRTSATRMTARRRFCATCRSKINKGETFALVGPSGGGRRPQYATSSRTSTTSPTVRFCSTGREIHSLTMESVRRNMRNRPAGHLPLQRVGQGEHPPRQARRHRRGSHGSGEAREHPRLHSLAP